MANEAARVCIAGDLVAADKWYCTGYALGAKEPAPPPPAESLGFSAAELTKAISLRGNEKDPFMRYLLGMTHERMGHMGVADPLYRQAYALATAHNPQSAFVRHALRSKFGDTAATDAAASR